VFNRVVKGWLCRVGLDGVPLRRSRLPPGPARALSKRGFGHGPPRRRMNPDRFSNNDLYIVQGEKMCHVYSQQRRSALTPESRRKPTPLCKCPASTASTRFWRSSRGPRTSSINCQRARGTDNRPNTDVGIKVKVLK
jgi:hypothetical protein